MSAVQPLPREHMGVDVMARISQPPTGICNDEGQTDLKG